MSRAQKMPRCCSQCGRSGHNFRTCGRSVSGGDHEIMLFGVRMKVDRPVKKPLSMNEISRYEQPNKNFLNNGNAVDEAGYNRSTGNRNRGNPWTVKEHKLFLLGLHKAGKGNWREISYNFVKTRTPTQVASHAQKHYLRINNLNSNRRRSSVFDITTDSVSKETIDNGGKGRREDTVVHGIGNNRKPIASWPPINAPVYGCAPNGNGVGFVLVPIVPVPLAIPSLKLSHAASSEEEAAAATMMRHSTVIRATLKDGDTIVTLT